MSFAKCQLFCPGTSELIPGSNQCVGRLYTRYFDKAHRILWVFIRLLSLLNINTSLKKSKFVINLYLYIITLITTKLCPITSSIYANDYRFLVLPGIPQLYVTGAPCDVG